MRKSSITVSYSDLLKWAKKQLGYTLQRQSSSIGRGVSNQEALTHDVECAKTLVRMLEKCEPGRQTDFFELFQQAKK